MLTSKQANVACVAQWQWLHGRCSLTSEADAVEVACHTHSVTCELFYAQTILIQRLSNVKGVNLRGTGAVSRKLP